MTTDPSLDAVIRHAQHMLFAFDGPIRSADEVKSAGSIAATPTSAHLHETLAACRESGRSVTIISARTPAEIRVYLDEHDLLTRVDAVAASISQATSACDGTPGDCLLITSSPTDVEAAQLARAPSIGFARTPGDAARLTSAGAIALVYSMADMVLRIRAHPLPS